jgi:hypothetical protein
MRWALVLVAALAWSEEWTVFRSGPFEVYARSEKRGREAMNYLEQLRHALGGAFGRQELTTVWPIRIALDDGPPKALALGEEAWTARLRTLDESTAGQIVQILIQDNIGPLPPELERGLVALYSTLEVQGTRVILGRPPANRPPEWLRVHMLSVHPDFSGKMRVLLSNLERGIEPEVAWRNAFGLTPEQAEERLKQYTAQSAFDTLSLSGKPLNPQRDLKARKVETQSIEMLLEPSGRVSARSLVEQARRETDISRARALLAEAKKLNPRWALPWWLEAQKETELTRKIQALKEACKLEPRNTQYWMELARSEEQAGRPADAAKSWLAAERAAVQAQERAEIQRLRREAEQAAIEKKLQQAEQARRAAQQELEELRQRMLEGIRQAEAKANADKPPLPPEAKLDWYDENDSGFKSVTGRLRVVECRGRQARLHIAEPGGKQTILLVKDPAKIVLVGGGERTLTCGPQQKAPPVRIEYIPVADERTPQVIGEAVRMEFR